MGTVSLIFGGASFLVGLCTCGAFGWLAAVLSVIGIGFGVAGIKEERQRGYA